MLDLYEEYLVERGLDPKTIGIYKAKIRTVLQLTDHYGWDINALLPSQARTIAQAFPNTPSSRRQLRTSMKWWWEMWEVRGPETAIRVPKAPRGQYRGLEDDEARLLAKAAVGWYPAGTAVLVMLYLGARNSECASLAWPNFTPQMDWVKIHGKHNKIRVVPVHPRLRLELRPHVGAYPYVFPGERGRSHVHTATVNNWVAEVCDAAGIRRVTPHQLRHTSIATMNDATGDLRTAQEFAGHSRPETTAIYTRTTAQKLVDAALFSFDWLDGV